MTAYLLSYQKILLPILNSIGLNPLLQSSILGPVSLGPYLGKVHYPIYLGLHHLAQYTRPLRRTTADFRHSHVSCGVPSSGEQVQEGLIQIAKSVLFIAEAALITVGGLAQGIGKVLNGLGMAVAERRALFSWKGF